MLARFGRRADLRRFRRRLDDSGIATTDIRYPFFFPTALRLARRHPQRLHVDWPAWEKKGELEAILHLLVPYAESPAIDEYVLTPRRWLELFRGPQEADGAFLALRFGAMAGDSFVRETSYDRLSPALHLAGDATTPSRTEARAPVARIAWQTTALDHGRPDLTRAVRAIPVGARALDRREGARYIEMARDAMVTRSRDLDAFSWADPEDVRLVACDDGLAFALLGVAPRAPAAARIGLRRADAQERRADRLRAGLVALRLGRDRLQRLRDLSAAPKRRRSSRACWRWPIASSERTPSRSTPTSSDTSAITRASLRGPGGSTPSSASARATPRSCPSRSARSRRSGATRSTAPTSQRSTGWRARTSSFRSVRREESRSARSRRAGSASASRATWPSGSAPTGSAASPQPSARRRNSAAFAPFAGWSAGERLAWRRWSPLLIAIPGIERWSAAERRAAGEVARAKGGRRESDFVHAFDAHPKLRRALLALATPD